MRLGHRLWTVDEEESLVASELALQQASSLADPRGARGERRGRQIRQRATLRQAAQAVTPWPARRAWRTSPGR